jgi:polyhydroxyalkanoate synthase
VWRRGRAQLWRYRGGEVRYGPPVVIVHSLVSRSYILDLRPGSSTVEYLVDAGLDVFLLDWGVPDERDADNTLETYVDGWLPSALAAVRRETGCDEVTLAGYCLGGVFAMLYAAGRPDAAVRNLVLMATPIDFSVMGPMVAALREGRLDADDLLDETGNVPADALYSGFYMLAPTTDIAQKATLLEHLWNDEFVEAYQAMAEWTRDHVPFPGAAFRQVVEQLVRENVLTTGAMRLGDRVVRLGDVRGDVLVATAERDGVVPADATEPALALVGDPGCRHALRLPGGHVTFGAGKAARSHTMPRLTEWITAHSDERPDPKEAGWTSAASSPPIGPPCNGSSPRSALRIARS